MSFTLPANPLAHASRFALLAIPVTAGTFAADGPSIALAMFGAIAVVLLGFLSPATIGRLVVASVFLSNFAIYVAGARVRPEHAAAFMVLVAVIVHGRLNKFLVVGTHPPSILLIAYVLYGLGISAVTPGAFTNSITILSWLTFDWILLTGLIALDVPRRVMLDSLAIGVLVTGLSAIVLWPLSAIYGWSWGMQREHPGQLPAAYIFVSEANILGGLLALSCITFLYLSRLRTEQHRLYRWAAVVSGLAIPTTQTRAALLAVVLGLVVFAFGGRNFLAVVISTFVFIAATTSSLGLNSISLYGVFKKFGDTFDLHSGNGAYRLNAIETAWHDFHGPREWFFGLGVNSFGLRHLDPTFPDRAVKGYLPSLPAQLLYDTGIIGCLLVAWLGYMLLVHSTDRILALALILCFFVVSAATSPFWLLSTWIFVYLGTNARTAVVQFEHGVPIRRDTNHQEWIHRR